jgi:hypothetical protein
MEAVYLPLKEKIWQNLLSGTEKNIDEEITLYLQHVQNPLVRALAREKADSRNAHPGVIANVEAANKRNTRKFVSEKGGCNWDQTKKAARYWTVRSDAIF